MRWRQNPFRADTRSAVYTPRLGKFWYQLVRTLVASTTVQLFNAEQSGAGSKTQPAHHQLPTTLRQFQRQRSAATTCFLASLRTWRRGHAFLLRSHSRFWFQTQVREAEEKQALHASHGALPRCPPTVPAPGPRAPAGRSQAQAPPPPPTAAAEAGPRSRKDAGRGGRGRAAPDPSPDPRPREPHPPFALRPGPRPPPRLALVRPATPVTPRALLPGAGSGPPSAGRARGPRPTFPDPRSRLSPRTKAASSGTQGRWR
ncbi:hypothetical protein P7K49_026040 [Saguinus oedipus]|uniref:Uncharacterized protein n=1 Tax=Saguinus oedipus TaxID=9490 RepID=A0ABQ9UIY5_SAGOE|nr:hypothetical protein P7K49_026040 [Saguinus oedipus]